jgi:peptidoglycan/LPS O-acetylase OafA/YrhL
MTAGGGAPPRSERFIAGNALRGIAVSFVVLNHSSVAAGIAFGSLNFGTLAIAHGLGLRIIQSATFWPVMFFTLSGYLLGRPFVQAFIAGTKPPSVRRYVRNRALRILPGLWTLVAIDLLLFGTAHSSLGDVLAVPLLVQTYFSSPFAHGINHAWTVGTEAAFYLVLPVGIWLLTRWAGRRLSPGARRRVVLGVALAIAAVSIALSATPGPFDTDRQHWFPMLLYGFPPGIALAAIADVAPAWLAARGDGRRLATRMLVWALVLLALYALSDTRPVLWTRSLEACVAAFLLVGSGLVRQWTDGTSWRLFDNRPLDWLGERSYSFYLFHVLVLRLVIDHLYSGVGPHAAGIYTALTFALTIPVAALGYALVERPFLARRRPWRTGAAPAPAPSPSPVGSSGAPGLAVDEDATASVPRLA